MGTLIFPILIFILIVAIARGIQKRKLQQARLQMCKNFEDKYGCTVPQNFHLATTKIENTNNHYKLEYPHWYYYNKDGTRDCRRKDNGISWGVCRLYLGNYILTCKNPCQMLNYVNVLRQNGVIINKTNLEIKKENKLLKEQQELSSKKSVTYLIDKFSQNPTDFENFCAQLYQSMNYKTTLTPPTNDGGFDIKIENDIENAIVECKCYSLNNKIGRPLIQKLVGANQTELADKMIFITTSDFTSSAKKYAEEVSVQLINGNTLVEMCNKYMYYTAPSSSKKINIDYSLCKEDISSYVAKDLLELL